MSETLSTRLREERSLIMGLQNKDKATFEKLYDNYSVAIYNSILKVLGNRDQADEVLQDTFLKVWNKIHLYSHEKGRLYTWMHKIARNLALDKVRSKEYVQMAVTDSWEDRGGYYQDVEDPGGVNYFSDDLLKFLNPAQSLVVNLMYFQGYTSEDVSKEYNIPVGTVKSRVRAALKRLRTIYGTV